MNELTRIETREEEPISNKMDKDRFRLTDTSNYKVYLSTISVVIVLLVVGQILAPGFASLFNLNTMLVLVAVLALASLGQMLIIISGNEGIDLSIGAVISTGALIIVPFIRTSALDIVTAILVLTFFGGLIGLINGITIQKIGVPALVITLAMANVLNGLGYALTKGQVYLGDMPILRSFGLASVGPVRWLFIAGIIILIFVELLLRKSRAGTNLYLIGSNLNAAVAAGMKTTRFMIITYVIAGAAAAISSLILVAHEGAPAFRMGEPYTLQTVMAVIIGGASLRGGKGTYIGVWLGALFLIVLSSFLSATGISAGVRELTRGLILLSFLFFQSRFGK